ncbi:MAG: triphosphoribosyl-dephospho-CoA synthase [Planctomycetes bacterium]|nr:triphosphoribosyl-dephospho-CoA synthase [Planctomycetota bacterium]
MTPPSIVECAQIACLLEVTARKPGNVHRFADFEDVTYLDFILSAMAMAPAMGRAEDAGVGRTILEAVEATQRRVPSNTNLGMILLFAPLAAVPRGAPMREGVAQVLAGLTRQDAEWAYEAIRRAHPGGLGRVDAQDVSQPPACTLRQAMALAADRDRIARQYANDFEDVLGFGLSTFRSERARFRGLETPIIRLHLSLMAEFPDTLIARKRGRAESEEAARRARQVLDAGWPEGAGSAEAISRLDEWLREGGHARNPGTSADLVAAVLFVVLRDGELGSDQILFLPRDWPGL